MLDKIKHLNKILKDMGSALLACLASRVPYGSGITKEKLFMIDRAEDFIRSLGFGNFRVRHHDRVARIELPRNDLPSILQKKTADKIITKLKELGYNYVTVDMEGYRVGSMNEVLNGKNKK